MPWCVQRKHGQSCDRHGHAEYLHGHAEYLHGHAEYLYVKPCALVPPRGAAHEETHDRCVTVVWAGESTEYSLSKRIPSQYITEPIERRPRDRCLTGYASEG